MQPMTEPGGQTPSITLGQEHLLVTSVAGLAARAVNEGRADELVWIEPRNRDYQIWYQSMTNRLRVADGGLFKPWDLVERFARRGIVKGYILYTYDPSPGDATHLRPGSDESVNVATTLAGLLDGVLVSEAQEARARELGLARLFDARGKTEAWCFERFRDRLNRRYAVVQDPKMPFCRDLAIAHRMMVMFGPDAPTPEVYAWLRPLSSIVGWNGGDEGKSVTQLSRAGHILLPANWSMNLCALSAGSEAWDGAGKLGAVNPRTIDFADGKHSVAFIMSDGDNVQWMMGSFVSHPDYWGSPDHGRYPLGWGAAIGCLDQCSPDTLAYLKRTQPPETTLSLHAGGYFYPDLLGADRTPAVRREILALHARRVSHFLDRSGCRTYMFLTMNLDSPGAHEAYVIFAREIKGLLGMFALQYYPYEAGDGKIFWVRNGRGDEIPVVTAKFRIWEDVPDKHTRAGTPTKVANAINQAARAATTTNGLLQAWCTVHTWSSFRRPANGTDQTAAEPGETITARAVTPARWCVEQLGPNIKVVTPEELLWRIRMTHAPERTAHQIERAQRAARQFTAPRSTSSLP